MFYHDGMWSKKPVFPTRCMEMDKTFPYTSDDVIIATYRKAGNGNQNITIVGTEMAKLRLYTDFINNDLHYLINALSLVVV